MTSIYDKHRKAFGNVSAYVIMIGGESVATIAFKYGNACTAFVHWHGVEMANGRACGYGYDKASAACKQAAKKIPPTDKHSIDSNEVASRAAFIKALEQDSGWTWYQQLERAGFTVVRAV